MFTCRGPGESLSHAWGWSRLLILIWFWNISETVLLIPTFHAGTLYRCNMIQQMTSNLLTFLKLLTSGAPSMTRKTPNTSGDRIWEMGIVIMPAASGKQCDVSLMYFGLAGMRSYCRQTCTKHGTIWVKKSLEEISVLKGQKQALKLGFFQLMPTFYFRGEMPRAHLEILDVSCLPVWMAQGEIPHCHLSVFMAESLCF